MNRGEIPHNIFVCGEGYESIDEVRTLMQAETVEEHHLAIDALRGWCFFLEDHTHPRRGRNFRDTHHWYQRPGMKGQPKNIYRNLPEHKELLRRDVHEEVEAVFGWLRPLHTHVVIEYIEREE